ncbi:PTS sugar transporter subunit IIA [Pararhizobium sp. PWRC1-1]|uniref:PTS sugar transporter subunit IIA n=1 Tax=Pararhizobium sp. PWRC1-1 TaxID=2804566 RepID=UPI003CF67849
MQDNDLCWDKNVILGIPAQDTRSVFQAIASHLADMTGLDPRAIFADLMDREALGSTGFGAGFALPHALVPNLASPAKVLVTLRAAIEFNAPDDQPVDVFLAVIWPHDQQESFLPGLAQQCRLFRSKKLLSALRDARSGTEALILLSVLESEQDLLENRTLGRT